MVLKIAGVSISNDVEMSPVSLYLVRGEIGAWQHNDGFYWSRIESLPEPGNLLSPSVSASLHVWLIILFFRSVAGALCAPCCTCWATWKPLLITCSQLPDVTCLAQLYLNFLKDKISPAYCNIYKAGCEVIQCQIRSARLFPFMSNNCWLFDFINWLPPAVGRWRYWNKHWQCKLHCRYDGVTLLEYGFIFQSIIVIFWLFS